MIGALATYWREAVIVGLVLALAGQQVRISNEKADHQTTKTQHAEVLRDLAEKTSAAYEALADEKTARAQAVAALDEKHTKELSNARTENSRLADAVRSGERRLRLRASCPATGTAVPQAPSTSGVADGPGPRLDDAAERDYFRLRDGITTAQRQIAGLQDYVRDVCLK
jgi:prophage endopeptidase